jgi:hypothetical protein
MTPTARQEYYSSKTIRLLTEERDRLLAEKTIAHDRENELRTKIDELQACKLELATLKVSHRRKRVLEAMAGAAAIFGGALTSAFPAGANQGFWFFTASQLFALGWLLLLLAGGWMAIKAVADL